ncbi:MAG TPA: class I SAM-dependent methyltransferase [Rhizomicrobium sp.]|nr:class I SAM-dependent methyltransferase [Rhizomicrobium sp.]
MLSAEEIDRIEENWSPLAWPDGAASDYAKAMHRRPYAYFCERVRHLGLSGKMLVDAGCGTGTWSFAFAGAFERVLAFDYTQERLAVADWLKDRFALSQPEFVPGDIRAIPVEDGGADAVFCYSVALGSVPLEKIYAEFHRVLRPGGVAYLELNGIGYGYNLFRTEGTRKVGADVVYNTYCQSALDGVIGAIRSQGEMNAAAPGIRHPASPLELLKAAGAGPAALAAAEAIVNDLGAGDLLMADLSAIARGERDRFSQPSTGRGYTPGELRAISIKAGFRRYEWAHEGMLSLQADGSVRKEKSPAAPPISAPEFEGHLRRFESLSWK